MNIKVRVFWMSSEYATSQNRVFTITLLVMTVRNITWWSDDITSETQHWCLYLLKRQNRKQGKEASGSLSEKCQHTQVHVREHPVQKLRLHTVRRQEVHQQLTAAELRVLQEPLHTHTSENSFLKTLWEQLLRHQMKTWPNIFVLMYKEINICIY